jgi:hypothetical protein
VQIAPKNGKDRQKDDFSGLEFKEIKKKSN